MKHPFLNAFEPLCISTYTSNYARTHNTQQLTAIIDKTATAKVSPVLVCHPFDVSSYTHPTWYPFLQWLNFFPDELIRARLHRSSSFLPFRCTLGLQTRVFFKGHVCEMVELGCKQCRVSALTPSLQSEQLRGGKQKPWPEDKMMVCLVIQPPPPTLTLTAHALPRPCRQKGIFPLDSVIHCSRWRCSDSRYWLTHGKQTRTQPSWKREQLLPEPRLCSWQTQHLASCLDGTEGTSAVTHQWVAGSFR